MRTSSKVSHRRPSSLGAAWVTRSVTAALALLTGCGGCGVDVEGITRAFVRAFSGERSAIAFGDGRFVTTGRLGIFVSEDGRSFELIPETGFLSTAVAHGTAGWIVADINALYVSDDGLTWSPTPLPLPEGHGAAFGAGRYVLVGPGGASAFSEDGRSWFFVATPTTEDLLGVAFVEDGFLAVGRNGAAVTSADGVEWFAVDLPTRETLRGVAYDDGTTIVTGSDGTVLRSAHGQGWEVVRTPTDAFLTAATFADGRFVVVGLGGTILVSTDDARTFEFASADFGEDLPADLPNDLLGVTHGEGLFVAVGTRIMVSSDGFSWARHCATAEGGCGPPES